MAFPAVDLGAQNTAVPCAVNRAREQADLIQVFRVSIGSSIAFADAMTSKEMEADCTSGIRNPLHFTRFYTSLIIKSNDRYLLYSVVRPVAPVARSHHLPFSHPIRLPRRSLAKLMNLTVATQTSDVSISTKNKAPNAANKMMTQTEQLSKRLVSRTKNPENTQISCAQIPYP